MGSSRRSVVWLGLVVLVAAACSSDSPDSASISFEQSFDGPTQVSLFAATGEAIDEGLICPGATGTFVGNEDADGNALSEAENAALYNGSERFVAVTVEEMTCDDGSGDFVFRVFTEIDPTDPDYAPENAEWTITGVTGYASTEGEGETSLPEIRDDGLFVWTGSGTINRQTD